MVRVGLECLKLTHIGDIYRNTATYCTVQSKGRKTAKLELRSKLGCKLGCGVKVKGGVRRNSHSKG